MKSSDDPGIPEALPKSIPKSALSRVILLLRLRLHFLAPYALACLALHTEPAFALTAREWASRVYDLAKQNRSEAALIVTQKAIEEYPEDPELLYLLGMAQQACGNSAGALLAWRKSYEIGPTPVTFNQLIQVYTVTNQTRAAMELLEKEASFGNNPQAHSTLARLYRQEFNMRDPLEHLRKAVALDPKRAEDWSELIDLLVFLGDVPSASAELVKCRAALGPGLVVSYWNGQIARASGNPRKAAREMGAALSQIKEPFSHWLMYYGLALSEAGDYAEARKALERAVAAQPSLGGAWYQLGRVCAQLKDAAAAKEALLIHQLLRGDQNKGWEAIPREHPAYPFVHERLAGDALAVKDAASAIQHASAVLAVIPNNWSALITLAEAHEMTGDATAALPLVLPLDSHIGADPQYQLLLSRIYQSLGNAEESARREALAHELSPELKRQPPPSPDAAAP